MLRDFLEETILTGRIRDKFLKDIPNSILLQNVNDYILSIESRDFIMKFSIKNPLKQLGHQCKELNLPIKSNSKNFSIDWGDDYSIQFYQLNYLLSGYLNNLIIPGTYTVNDNLNKIHIYYTNDKYIEISDIDISNFYLEQSKKLLMIKKNKNNIYNEPKIISNLFLQDYTTHKYTNQGQYYIKICGGFTGFTGPEKLNYINNNPFYLTSQSNGNELEYNYLLEILSWGSHVNWETLKGAFYGAKKLISLPQEKLPNVNDFVSAFCYCSNLKKLNYNNIFPNAMISASYMFAYSGLEENLKEYKFPSNLTCVNYMFAYTNINELPQNWENNYYYNSENIALNTKIS